MTAKIYFMRCLKYFIGFLVVLAVSSCGTARMSVVVKSTADGTLTSNISINGSTEGGAVTPNVKVSADSSKVEIPLNNVSKSH